MSQAAPQSDLSSPALPQGRRGVWPLVLVAATVVWTAAMMASLGWHAVGRWPLASRMSPVGEDFFQTPRGFLNLLAGTSPYLSEISDYGPAYATNYYTHPFAAVLVGPWTAPLPPWAAFGVFFGVSVGLLWLAARLLASAFNDPTRKAFCYFATFCCLPVYQMLWEGQVQVFVILAVALILAGLMRLEQEPQSARRYLRWIQAGLLISLLVKPLVLVLVPALFALPEVRWKLLLPVAVYAAVSIAFLLVPRLNPGGYNAVHWLYMLNVSRQLKPNYALIFPLAFDLTRDTRAYSLPALLYRTCGEGLVSYVAMLPPAAVIAMSVTPFFLPERGRRIRAAIVAVTLGMLSFFLSYCMVWEHNYATMLPALPVVAWLAQREVRPGPRRLLIGVLCVSLAVFLPTLGFVMPGDPNPWWLPSALHRLLPVAAAFVGLFVYGTVLSWRAWRWPRPAASQATHGILGPLCVGGTMAALLGAVLAAAYATVPGRLLKPYDRWGPRDWMTHFEDVLSRPGVAPRPSGKIHLALGDLYHRAQPRRALEHYRAVAAVPFDSALDCKELGARLFDLGQRDASLRPECAQVLTGLAWRLATCDADALRNGEGAVEFATWADQLSGGGRAETLQALAAAYAEAGRFSEARSTAGVALDLAVQQNKAELAESLRRAIGLYESNRPVRQPPLAQSPR